MTPEEALALVESLLEGQPLKGIQKQVFYYAWQRLTYPEIAEQTQYDTSYIRDIGSELWQQLSQVFGEPVTKNTVQSVVRRQVGKRQRSSPPQFDTATVQQHPLLSDACEVLLFCGRDQELTQLEQWIRADHCRLISVLGMGGIGKTTLAAKLAQRLTVQQKQAMGNGQGELQLPSLPAIAGSQFANPFTHIIWQSLRNAPPIREMLAALIASLSDQQEIALFPSLDAQISRFMDYLCADRCLLVLDNFDAILSGNEMAAAASVNQVGNYRDGYEDYDVLLRRIGLTPHSSCVVLTSREQPKTLSSLAGDTLPVRSLRLTGLSPAEAKEILTAGGCFAIAEADWTHLPRLYGGNPLALRIIASTVRDLFDGNITTFLQQGAIAFGDINALLAEQFQRLSQREKQVMAWLAIQREDISLGELQANFVPQLALAKVLEAVQSLSRRSLIETSGNQFTLQPVVMEYVTGQLIDQVCTEITTGHPIHCFPLFFTHALMQAQAKAYVRESQRRLIIQPLIAQLLNQFRSKKKLVAQLHHWQMQLQEEDSACLGYGGGNLLHLYDQLQVDLTGYDFSGITIRQAYLQGVSLKRVNFTQAKLVQCVFTQTFGGILAIAFSPDGKLLFTGDSTGRVWLWRVADSQPLWVATGHSQWVRSVAFSPDGITLASCSLDQTIKLWDAETGHLLQTLQGHSGAVRAVAFSPDGSTIASGGLDQTIRLWEVSTGQLLKTWHGHTNMVKSVVFSPDGTRIASGSFDYTVKLWQITTGTLLHTLPDHHNVILTVAWSPDGTTIASCGGDHTIKLWNASTGELLRTLKGHRHWVISVQFSPDNQRLVSSSDDRTVRLWEVHTGQLLKTLQGHRYWVHGVAFNAQGTLIASGSDDQTVKFWDAQTGDLLSTLQGYTNSVLSVAWSPDGQILATSSTDCRIRLWQVSTGQVLKTLEGHSHWVWSLAFSPDGTRLASGSDDQTAKLWQIPTGTLSQTFAAHTHWVLSIAFSPDGRTLATGSIDRKVRLWDAHTGQLLNTLEGHTNLVWSVAFNQTGQQLVSSGDDHTVKLWQVPTGQLLNTFVHPNAVLSAKWSPDDRTIVTGSADHQLRIWDAQTGQIKRTLQGHQNQVLCVAFSPDGALIASGSSDQTAKVWSAQTGQCLTSLQEHTDWVQAVAFSPDGQWLASGSGDQTTKLWELQTGQCLTTLVADRPYEGMNITAITGLTDAHKATLKALGAVED